MDLGFMKDAILTSRLIKSAPNLRTPVGVVVTIKNIAPICPFPGRTASPCRLAFPKRHVNSGSERLVIDLLGHLVARGWKEVKACFFFSRATFRAELPYLSRNVYDKDHIPDIVVSFGNCSRIRAINISREELPPVLSPAEDFAERARYAPSRYHPSPPSHSFPFDVTRAKYGPFKFSQLRRLYERRIVPLLLHSNGKRFDVAFIHYPSGDVSFYLRYYLTSSARRRTEWDE